MINETVYFPKTEISAQSEKLLKKTFRGFKNPEKYISNDAIATQIHTIDQHDSNKKIGVLRISKTGQIIDVNSTAVNLYHVPQVESKNISIGEYLYIKNTSITPDILDLIIDENNETHVFQLNNGFQIAKVKTIIIPMYSDNQEKEYLLLFFCYN